MRSKIRIQRGRSEIRRRIGKLMNCLCSEEQLRAGDEMVPSSESLATKDYSRRGYSPQACEAVKKLDAGNIEEAESSLRESGCLNYEEARALLGRYEYQKGNIEAALRVFEGIDVNAIIPKVMITIARRGEHQKRCSISFDAPPMSMHAVSLLLEAIFLKSKSLQSLARYREAAQSCQVILDIVESSVPKGMPINFLASDSKLQETLNNTVELLPELWKQTDSPTETILSYRRALLHHWNLDTETTAKIEKEFAIFLLYTGGEASPPNLRSQMDTSFVPRNNTEEAILLLMILLRKVTLKKIEWDPSILDHLSFALSISDDTRTLASQVEELLPSILDRKERYHTLALCYYGAGEELTALNLLRKIVHPCEDPKYPLDLLMASKICTENRNPEDGEKFARKALQNLDGRCDQLKGVANFLLGLSLSECTKSAIVDSERVIKSSEALQVLENAGRLTRITNPDIIYHLCLENAEQRKLDAAISYAKHLLKLEGGSNVKSWLLMAQVLSAQKRFDDGKAVIEAALDQTGKWDQGELLRTKAKLLMAQGELNGAIETYMRLLAHLQVQSKSFGSGKKILKGSRSSARSMELDTWLDLANVYIGLSQWHDAEICLSKSKAIRPYSASRCHTIGVLLEAKGLHKDALKAFKEALDIDPSHVSSLISVAAILRKLGRFSHPIVQCFLMEALRLDRLNYAAWYNLGLYHKSYGSIAEAVECFEAAAFLQDTAPVEPFR